MVLPSEDPKAQVLFQESEFGNYMISSTPGLNNEENINNSNGLWILDFDGSCAVVGLGAGIVLISPEGELFPRAFKLDFDNTNNTVEYESLLLGIEEANKIGIKMLKAKGDAELVVRQVRGMYSAKNERLKHYRNQVWDEIEEF